MTKLVLICWWVLCSAVAVSVTGSSVDRVLVSVIPWEPGNQAMMGSPRPWDPDTIHRSWSSSKPHCITNNLNSHAHKTLSVTKYDQMFYTCPGAYESQILSVYISFFVSSAFKPCTQVVRIWIRASSTMVGIQAMTRSISQFLNRHSQSLSPATARPSHALQRQSHRRHLYR